MNIIFVVLSLVTILNIFSWFGNAFTNVSVMTTNTVFYVIFHAQSTGMIILFIIQVLASICSIAVILKLITSDEDMAGIFMIINCGLLSIASILSFCSAKICEGKYYGGQGHFSISNGPVIYSIICIIVILGFVISKGLLKELNSSRYLQSISSSKKEEKNETTYGCPNCGHEFKKKFKKCPKCGIDLDY